MLEQPNSGFTFYGSSASGIVVGSGATEYVLSGGSAISTTVDSGGGAFVYSGGTASLTTLSGSTEFVLSGGTSISATVDSGGTELVFFSGTTSFTTASSGGGVLVNGGTTVSARVDSGGFETVSGGTTSDTTISSFGHRTRAVGRHRERHRGQQRRHPHCASGRRLAIGTTRAACAVASSGVVLDQGSAGIIDFGSAANGVTVSNGSITLRPEWVARRPARP